MYLQQDPAAPAIGFCDRLDPRLPEFYQAKLCRNKETVQDDKNECNENQR
jgi:hypothetical protein